MALVTGMGAGVLDAGNDLSALDLRPRFRPDREAGSTPAARLLLEQSGRDVGVWTAPGLDDTSCLV